MSDKGENVKIRINYEKGSQTLSKCDPTADSEDLFAVAEAVAGLQDEDVLEYVKITEARLVG